MKREAIIVASDLPFGQGSRWGGFAVLLLSTCRLFGSRRMSSKGPKGVVACEMR